MEGPRFSVCGEAYDRVKAIEEVQRLKPDVAVLKKFGTENPRSNQESFTIMEVCDSITILDRIPSAIQEVVTTDGIYFCSEASLAIRAEFWLSSSTVISDHGMFW